MRSQLTKCQL